MPSRNRSTDAQRWLSAVNRLLFSPRPLFFGYLMSLFFTLGTFFVRKNVAVYYGDRPLLIMFMFPIILSAYLHGAGPGILTTIFSFLITDYYLFPPKGSFLLSQPHDFIQLLMLLVNGFLVSLLIQALHNARSGMERYAADLLTSNTRLEDLDRERKRYLAELEESELRLKRAEEISKLGHWRSDAARMFMECSEGLYRLFNLDPASGLDMLHWLTGHVHADDREEFISFVRGKTNENNEVLRGEFRFVPAKGRELRVRVIRLEDRHEHGGRTGVFGVMQDVTLLRKKEQELTEKSRELESFTHMVSHDLKSPLITITTFLEFLKNDLKSDNPERINKDIEYIGVASERMNRLLTDLLELSRVGRINEKTEPVTFRELADDALSMVAGQLAERKPAVAIRGEGDVNLVGDRHRLAQIWQNLIDNAIKYSGDQQEPRVEIGFQRDDDEVEFYVLDNGAGMNPPDLERVFMPFEKLDSSSEGSGLGLSLVKRIVEHSGGRIRAESAGKGQGSCFRFTLPAALASGASPGKDMA